LLTVALVAGGLLVAALVYGFATRALTPRTVPERTEAVVDTSGQARALAAARALITVDVRNGAGVNGLAARVRTLLRARGFDVLEVGTGAAADSTVVTVRNGTPADAAHVAGALGLPRTRVVGDTTRDENAATVSVTLGRDYARFGPLRDLD
jgi:hypothetical protein